MKSNQYSEYKKGLALLSDEEIVERDLHLKELLDGTKAGPLTGKASLDKPWLKYFSYEKINENVPNMTCYQYLIECNKDHLDDYCFEYIGNKTTYKDFFHDIYKTAQAFQTLGIKKGDYVSIFSITTPEIKKAFYALNMIGAIPNMVDIRYTSQAYEHYIKEVDSKYAITLDICYPHFEQFIDRVDMNKVIFIPALNSAPKAVQKVMGIKEKLTKTQTVIPDREEYILWNDFMDQAKNDLVNEAEYDKDRPAVMVHTGGTTGEPKGVLLTNYNINTGTIEIKNCNADTSRGDRFLNIMPPFIAYGLVLGLHTPLCLGWYGIIVPKFDPNKFDDLILKNKPTTIIGVPAYWENVMKSKKIKNKELPYIKTILLGGDKTTGEFETRLKEFLSQHNCDALVGKGYSLTEASACGTFSSKDANELDSVGIALPKSTIGIFEPGTFNELDYNEVGEICIQSPSRMKGYYNKEKQTKEIIKEHEDGSWIHTADLGYMNENGIVFIKDRIKRMIVRSGFKVFPSELEAVYLAHPAVQSCVVVRVDDRIDTNAPKAFIVLKEEYKGQEDTILEELATLFENSILAPYYQPVDFEFRDELPLTAIGKVDFSTLEQEECMKRVLKK